MQNNSRFLILDGLSLIRDYEDSGYASYRHVRELITDILASDLLNSPTNGDMAYEVLGRLESILAELPEPVLGGVTHPIAIYTANGQILLSGPSAGPNDLYGSMPNVGIKNLPSNAKNTISYENIRTGNEQVITLIGCGGDRDAAKRPVMAAIACEYSNKVILTSDNPRSEDPEEILNQMQKGINPVDAKKTLRITDRKEAIKTACQLSRSGDIILIAGKGHEKYQEIKGVKHNFDDYEILKETIKTLGI